MFGDFRDFAAFANAYRRGTKLLAPYYLQDWLTLTRASQGTIYDAGSTLQTIGAGLPRWDWNPATGEFRGLLFEEQRVNRIRNPNLLGANVGVVGSGGSWPTNCFVAGSNFVGEVLAIGNLNGLPYVDIKITPAVNENIIFYVEGWNSNVACVQGDKVAFSLHFEKLSGSFTPAMIMRERGGGATLGNEYAQLVSDGVEFTTRSVFARTVLHELTDSTIVSLRAAVLAGQEAIFRVGALQCEIGSLVASSFIPSDVTTSQTTRNRDELGGTLPAALQTADGHWEIDADLGDVPRNAGQVLFRLRKFDDPFTTAERRVTWDPVNKRVTASITDGPASVVDQTISSANDSWTSGRKRVGLITDTNSARTRLLLDGAVVGTLEHNQLITAAEDLYIGRNPGDANTDFVGHIRNMTHIPVIT